MCYLDVKASLYHGFALVSTSSFFHCYHYNGARGIQTMEWIVLTCFNIDQRESRSKGHFTLVSAVIASPWDWTNDQRSKNSSLLRLKLFGFSWKLSMLFGSFNGENPMLGFFPLHDLEKNKVWLDLEHFSSFDFCAPSLFGNCAGSF